jgi:hypothetical protein
VQEKSFIAFIDLWNEEQQYDTPLIHQKMAKWLQAAWEKGEKKLLLMAFRASGKSTIVGLFSAWLLATDQNLRILVLAADSALARKMVWDVKKIIEQHPKTKHLVPKKIEQWASNRFTIERMRQLRDPSMLGMGVTSNITGSRADIIIYDDVEVPNTCNTAEKREALRTRLIESNFILVPDGTQLYIGTPHSYFSIYAKNPRSEIGEETIFLNGFKRLILPILNKLKQSVWPERFTKEYIANLKEQSGPAKFASQMMLKPINILESRLNHELIKFYDAPLIYKEVNKNTVLSIGDKKIISCSAWWDPSYASAKGDNSVLAIVFTDEEGANYLHHLEYIQVLNTKLPESKAQCQIVADILKKYYCPSVTIEMNGIGGFLPDDLKNTLALNQTACAVSGYSNHRPKNERILCAFDALLAAQNLYVHESVRETSFIREMMEWNPASKNNQDDGLDAVAGALSQEPIRIKRFYSNVGRKWNPQPFAHKADSNFDV